MSLVPVNDPSLDGLEEKYLLECIRGGWISGDGPMVARFEEEFAARVGRKYGVAVCNGSAALEVAVAALRLGPGDEVIMPTFTIIACAAAVIRAGGVPVLVDCDPMTWNMTADTVREQLSPRTRAIMVVHIYGLPVEMAPILQIAHEHGLAVIEDAAEMHGQTCEGQACGSFGDISTFSFYANKHLTTGEGGMLVTDDTALAERCRYLRNQCFTPANRFVHEELGWNFRMTSMQAAVGLAQLDRLDEVSARKRRMGRRYTELLGDLDAIQLPLPRTDYAESIYWVYGIVLCDSVPFDASEAMRQLRALDIETRPFFWPMHEQPVFRKMGLFGDVECPVAERIARRGFYLPSGVMLHDEQMDRVCRAMHDVFA